MANVKVTQDNNGVRWLELMRNGSGTLLEIRNDEEAMQIMVALQQSVQLTGLSPTFQLRCVHGYVACGDCGTAQSPRN